MQSKAIGKKSKIAVVLMCNLLLLIRWHMVFENVPMLYLGILVWAIGYTSAQIMRGKQ